MSRSPASSRALPSPADEKAEGVGGGAREQAAENERRAHGPLPADCPNDGAGHPGVGLGRHCAKDVEAGLQGVLGGAVGV
jgi:hypothetical protein